MTAGGRHSAADQQEIEFGFVVHTELEKQSLAIADETITNKNCFVAAAVALLIIGLVSGVADEKMAALFFELPS